LSHSPTPPKPLERDLCDATFPSGADGNERTLRARSPELADVAITSSVVGARWGRLLLRSLERDILCASAGRPLRLPFASAASSDSPSATNCFGRDGLIQP